MKDNWSKIIIGEHVNLLGGFPFNSAKFNDEGIGVPLIRIRDLLESKQETYYSGEYSEVYLIEKEDVLVGMDGDFHVVKWKNSPSLLNQRILKISEKKNSRINIDFLFYYLKPLMIDVHNKTAATTVKHLSTFDISLKWDLFPPLTYQRKIAKILSTCDSVIEQTQKAIDKYQAIMQGMMHDLFTRGIDIQTGKLRPKFKDAPEHYKESELGMIPKGWEVKRLGSMVIQNLYGPRFSANDYNKDGNVKTIRGMDFSKEGEILYDQAPIAFLPTSKIQAHLLQENDVVVVTTADCGLTAVFQQQDFDYIPSAYSVKYRFNQEMNPYYFKYFMGTDFAIRQVNKYVRQGTLGNLPGSDVLEFLIAKPNNDEQVQIVERIQSINSKIELEYSSLNKQYKIKSGLMQDLLSGKVNVIANKEEKIISK